MTDTVSTDTGFSACVALCTVWLFVSSYVMEFSVAQSAMLPNGFLNTV